VGDSCEEVAQVSKSEDGEAMSLGEGNMAVAVWEDESDDLYCESDDGGGEHTTGAQQAESIEPEWTWGRR